MSGTTYWVGQPTAIEHDAESVYPPELPTPVLKGLLLRILTKVVVSFAWLRQILYHIAGFPRLRNHAALKDIQPRLDPTVIKTDGKSPPSIESVLAELRGENFDSRRVSKTPFYSALDYHEAYKSQRLTPTLVVESLLPLILRDVRAPTQHSIAFTESRVDLIRSAAQASTERYEAGKSLSPLDGVPVVYKDQIDLEGYKEYVGSKKAHSRRGNPTSYCALPWQLAGAIVIGKTNMHEFGMDTTNLNPNWGTPLNPYNNGYFTGGSSGGSGYALGAGLVPIAHGADGGGSIRIPSGYCGVYGLKTTHGRLAVQAFMGLWRQIWSISRSQIAHRLMGHPDSLDPIAKQFLAPGSTRNVKTRPRLLGIDRKWIDRADPIVQQSFHQAVDWLAKHKGYEVVDISLPILFEAQLSHALSITLEVSSHVADSSFLTAPNQLRLAIIGEATAIDMFQAQKVRTVLMEHLAYLYSLHPGMIILTPTTPNAGWKIQAGDLAYGISNDAMTIKSMTYVILANFAGNPALSAPIGYVEEEGGSVPINIMGMGEWCSEDELLCFGYDCESYLYEGLDGGRRQPKTWVDVLGSAIGN